MSIVLQVVCSSQVKKNASLWVGDQVPWTVDSTKPFSDEANFGKLCGMLNIHTSCELCHYAEGVIGDPIELSRTPEELGYRPRMQLYVRLKKATKSGEGKVAESVGVKISPEEEKLLRKLRQNLVPNMGPDDPCPLCTRTLSAAQGDDPTMPPSAAKVLSAASPSAGAASSPIPAFGSSIPKLRPEVGVQCGQASRIHESPIAVQFGSAARLKQWETETYFGSPKDFPGPARDSADTSGNFLDFSKTITDLKADAERFQRDRDQLALELREMTKQKVTLEQWKAEHRCEASAEVSTTKQQLEQMQCNLRDLMRGRDEVFGILQQRRQAGSLYGDTPRPYASFATSIPSLGSSPNPHSLLAKDFSTIRKMPMEMSAADAGQENDTDVQVLKLPSGQTAPQQGSLRGRGGERAPAQQEELGLIAVTQRPGECLLRVVSISGPVFHVKRKITSQMRNGRHILTLLSLDDVVTDEIFVEELESASVSGTTSLRLQTSLHDWQLYVNPAERQRWLHWMYALNPYLSATAQMSAGGVPNSA